MYIKQTGFIDFGWFVGKNGWKFSPFFLQILYDFIAAAVLSLGHKLPIIIKAIYKFYYLLV